MDLFVCYHNPERMGYGSSEVDRLACYTSHHGRTLPEPGALVYLVGRDFDDPHYYLDGAFRVEEVRSVNVGGFTTEVRGTQGALLGRRKRVVLDEQPWFAELKREQGNFGFGLNRVGSPRVAKAFYSLIPPATFRRRPPPERAPASPHRPRALAVASGIVWVLYHSAGAIRATCEDGNDVSRQSWSFMGGGGVDEVLVFATEADAWEPRVRARARRFVGSGINRRACLVSSALSATPRVEWMGV